MTSSTKAPEVFLSDLFRFEHFKSRAFNHVGPFDKEKFVHFSSMEYTPRTSQESAAVFDHIHSELKGNAELGSVLSGPYATGFKVLRHFGFISASASNVALGVFKSNGRVATHKDRFVTYEVDCGGGLWLAGGFDPHIEKIISYLREGEKVAYKDVEPQITMPHQKIVLGRKLSAKGVEELFKLEARIAEIRKSLPTAEDVCAMPVTDAKLLVADEALKKAGLHEFDIDRILGPRARDTLQRLRQEQAAAPKVDVA